MPLEIPYNPPYGLSFTRPHQHDSQLPPLDDALGGEVLPMFEVTSEQIMDLRHITQ